MTPDLLAAVRKGVANAIAARPAPPSAKRAKVQAPLLKNRGRAFVPRANLSRATVAPARVPAPVAAPEPEVYGENPGDLNLLLKGLASMTTSSQLAIEALQRPSDLAVLLDAPYEEPPVNKALHDAQAAHDQAYLAALEHPGDEEYVAAERRAAIALQRLRMES